MTAEIIVTTIIGLISGASGGFLGYLLQRKTMNRKVNAETESIVSETWLTMVTQLRLQITELSCTIAARDTRIIELHATITELKFEIMKLKELVAMLNGKKQ